MSNTPSKKRKRIIPIVIILVLLAAALGICPYFESKIVKNANEDLSLFEPFAVVKAEQISASLFSKSITYKNVSFDISDLKDIRIIVGEIKQSGTDWDTLLGKPGDLTSIDSITYKDIKILWGNMEVVTVPLYEIKGISMAYRDIRAAALKIKDQGLNEENIIEFFPLVTKNKFDSARAENISVTVMGGKATIESIEGKDYAFPNYGPAVLNKLDVEFAGKKIVTLEKAGCDGIIMPPLFVELFNDPAATMGNNELLMDFDRNPLKYVAPMEIKNVRFQGLKVMSPVSTSLDELYYGLKLEKDAPSNFELGFKNWKLSQELIAMMEPLRPALEVLEGPLDLSLDVNGSFTPTDESDIVFNVKLSDTALGSCSMDLQVIAPQDLLVNSSDVTPDTVLLKSFDFSIEDKGIVGVFVAVVGANSYWSESYDESYAQIMQSLDDSLVDADPFQTEVLNALKALLQDGGTFTLSVKPEKPINLEALVDAADLDPKSVGASVTYVQPTK